MDESILTVEKAAMERWRNGDPLGFLEISDDEICYVDPFQTKPIIGIKAYEPFMKSIEGQVHYDKSEFIDPKVVIVGQAALLTYNYRSTSFKPDGSIAAQTPWSCTSVQVKRPGGWRVVHNHWSFIHQRLPESVEVPLPVFAQPIKFDGLMGELMRLEAGAMARWDKGDPWGFIEISAPDVTYFDTGTPQRINGLEALSAEYKRREGKISYEVMDFIDPWVKDCGDLAVMFYRFLSTRLNPDGTVASRVPWNCSEVFQRMQGTWKILHTHWSFIRGEMA